MSITRPVNSSNTTPFPFLSEAIILNFLLHGDLTGEKETGKDGKKNQKRQWRIYGKATTLGGEVRDVSGWVVSAHTDTYVASSIYMDDLKQGNWWIHANMRPSIPTPRLFFPSLPPPSVTRWSPLHQGKMTCGNPVNCPSPLRERERKRLRGGGLTHPYCNHWLFFPTLKNRKKRAAEKHYTEYWMYSPLPPTTPPLSFSFLLSSFLYVSHPLLHWPSLTLPHPLAPRPPSLSQLRKRNQ